MNNLSFLTNKEEERRIEIAEQDVVIILKQNGSFELSIPSIKALETVPENVLLGVAINSMLQDEELCLELLDKLMGRFKST